MEIYKLLNGISYRVIQGSDREEVSNISWDTRRIKSNSLFICVKNRIVDRHEFALDAVKGGATGLVIDHEVDGIPEDVTIIMVEDSRKAMAAIASNFYGEPSSKFNLIGVTGTNGKTSVTYFISKILEGAGRKTGIIGTIENSIGGRALSAEKLNPTTPDAIELQESFREMLNEGAEDVVMEVTSSALSQDRVYKCDFNIGIFTNLTQDHLEEHGTMENYKRAKMKLFTMCKTGIINVDDEISDEIIREASGCKIITYGIDREADFRAEDIEYSLNGVSFKLKYDGKTRDLKLKVPGRFSVYNALAATAAGVASGLSIDEAAEKLSLIEVVRGRFESVPNKSGVLTIVDYAHSPDSLEKVLTSVKEFSKGKIITVFGCGGNRDKTKRPIMGEIAGRLSDFCVITSDNPRNEEPLGILDDIERGTIKTDCKYIKLSDRREGIQRALEMAQEGDCVIVAGKGHETYQILGSKTIHFDDAEVIREYFNSLGE